MQFLGFLMRRRWRFKPAAVLFHYQAPEQGERFHAVGIASASALS